MQTRNTAALKRNLTEGNVLKKLIFFALPLMASNVVMNVYSIAEAIIAGNSIGSDAIAAIGCGMPIIMLLFGLFMGFNLGSEIVISQFYGARDTESLKRVAGTIFAMAKILALATGVFGFAVSEPLLKLLGTPAGIIGDAASYLRIFSISLVCSVIYMNCCSMMRGMGDSRWPMYFNIGCSGLNILLDILFIVVFGWSVKGIAFATVISQLSAAIAAYFWINSGKYDISVRLRQTHIEGGIAKTVIRLALPNSIQQMAMAVAGLAIQYFANPFGSAFISANILIFRIDSIVVMPLYAFGMAMTTFSGQNIGARRLDRVKQAIKAGASLVAGVGLAMGIIMWTLGPFILRLFTDNIDVIKIGIHGIRILAFTYLFSGLDNCIAGAVRGAGATFAPMVNSIAANLVRIPAAYLLAVLPGNYSGIFFAMPFMVGVSFIMIITYYSTGRWQSKAVVYAGTRTSSI